VCANISNLSLRKKFDLVLNLFFSVGFYRTERQNFKFLKSLINHLEKNGVFVLQTHIFKERFDHNNIVLNEDRILKNGSILRINKVLNKNREEGTWAIIKNNKIVEQCFYSMRVYSLEELELLLFKLGLKVISIYGGWDGNSFIKNESHNLIILAKKVDDD
jgi:hypothetical protein